jgi:prepilin-type N-terminal cleavage/methylation domain-containing protein
MSRNNRAFTIVELMLAMSVLSMLLLAIAMLVIQIGQIYNKGVTLKSLNQAASVVSKDIQSTLGQADASAVKVVASLPGTNGSGRMCTGTITYAWNTARDTSAQVSTRNKYSGADAGKEIRLARIDDKGGNLCDLDIASNSYAPIDHTKSREMLPTSQYDFAVHDLYIGSNPSDLTLHWVVMKIGSTNISDTNLTTQQCLVGTGVGDYCGISTFEFTSKSNSEV